LTRGNLIGVEQCTQQNIKMYLKIASFTIFDLSLLILVPTYPDRNTKPVSILKLIERRFNLAPLSARDADPKINDLTHTLSEQDCTRDHE
jgi:hypothetical protein